jgi:hypothetical protein
MISELCIFIFDSIILISFLLTPMILSCIHFNFWLKWFLFDLSLIILWIEIILIIVIRIFFIILVMVLIILIHPLILKFIFDKRFILMIIIIFMMIILFNIVILVVTLIIILESIIILLKYVLLSLIQFNFLYHNVFLRIFLNFLNFFGILNLVLIFVYWDIFILEKVF